jgi:heme exporter protein CcmD
MGQYAAFVWPAYAVSVVVLAGATTLTLVRYRRVKTQLAALENR